MAAPGARPYLIMLGGALSFSAMGALAKAAPCDWRLVAFARAAVMLVFAVLIALVFRVPIPFLRPAALWVRSVFGTASLFTSFYALTHLPLADATTLIYMTSVWVTILSWPVLGERPPLRVWIAVAAALTGVFLIAQPHFEGERLAAVLGACSSLFTAIVMISLHRLGGVDPRVVVVHFAIFATAATAILFVAAPAAIESSRTLDLRTTILLVAMGGVGTVGQFLMTRAFAAGNPPRVALIGLTQLVFAAVIDRVVWNRTWNVLTLVGMALVAAPSAWLLLRQVAKKAAPEPVLE
jgi:drug/metabolite transporter (DMT)-like permease